jgi:hypothetical protein
VPTFTSQAARKPALRLWVSNLQRLAAVATYYDQRHSTGDAEVAALIKAGVYERKQPGRELWFKKVLHLEYEQLSEVWGTALVLKPSSLAGHQKATPVLTWPDRVEPVDAEKQDVFETMEM